MRRVKRNPQRFKPHGCMVTYGHAKRRYMYGPITHRSVLRVGVFIISRWDCAHLRSERPSRQRSECEAERSIRIDATVERGRMGS